MGFFKKVFKKVKKGFKSIGKGIKSAFKKIGKFMGKIGIVGQLALMFTPVGAMMGNMFAGIGNVAGQTFRGVTGALAQGGKMVYLFRFYSCAFTLKLHGLGPYRYLGSNNCLGRLESRCPNYQIP